MREAHVVDVENCLEQLNEVVLADLLTEGARVGDVVEKFTSLDQFLHDVGHFDLRAVRLGHHG